MCQSSAAFKRVRACTYEVNIDVIIVGADRNIGELYGMVSILQALRHQIVRLETVSFVEPL
jgi:hypothetical protein